MVMGCSRQFAVRSDYRRRVRREHGCKPPAGQNSVKIYVGLVALLCLVAAGCGYHTAGHATTIPTSVQTIAIPAFVNQTQTYKIEQTLTAAVVREMVTRTHYHVVHSSDAAADATLSGTVLSTYTAP